MFIVEAWKALSSVGQSKTGHQENQHLLITINQTMLVIISFSLLYNVFYIAYDFQLFIGPIATNFACVILHSLCFLWTKNANYRGASLHFVITGIIQLTALTYFLGSSSGVNLWLITIGTTVFLFVPRSDKALSFSLPTVSIVFFIWTEIYFNDSSISQIIPKEIALTLYAFNIAGSIYCGALIAFFFQKTLIATQKELERLNQFALDANPMTQLPGNNSIRIRIEKALEKNEKVCVIYSDLDNFKAFNDKYGFSAGDDVIIFTANVILDATKALGNKASFCGHIGGDDFIALAPSDEAHRVVDSIIRKFDEGIREFYSKEDLAQKYIRSINRQGHPQDFPIMSISLAGVDFSTGNYQQYIQINDMCAETKKRAKAIVGSNFILDQRKVDIIADC